MGGGLEDKAPFSTIPPIFPQFWNEQGQNALTELMSLSPSQDILLKLNRIIFSSLAEPYFFPLVIADGTFDLVGITDENWNH